MLKHVIKPLQIVSLRSIQLLNTSLTFQPGDDTYDQLWRQQWQPLPQPSPRTHKITSPETHSLTFSLSAISHNGTGLSSPQTGSFEDGGDSELFFYPRGQETVQG